MKLLTLFFLFASIQALASLTPVSFEKNGAIVTEQAVRYNGGYGYNLDAKHVLKLVTLDWPPYIDENLCNKGWLYQFAVSSLLEKGYGVHISFYPWARAVREAELGRADILFPEYFIDDDIISDNFINKTRNELLALSKAIPGGDLSFVALKGNKITFNGDLNSVKDLSIGVVRSYKNTKELDTMIDNKEIDTIVANNEYQLVHLLLNNRISLIVADFEVLKASVYKSELAISSKRQILQSIVPLEPKLEYKPLHFSVSKSIPHWRDILKTLNDKIEMMEQSGKFDEFIIGMQQQCFRLDEAA